MISLKCPDCGGKLELPENLEIAHCIYCGTKILLSEMEIPKDKLRLKSFLDICESAFKSKNYQETIDYSNKILEIDSKNFDAWIYKARATVWLSTNSNIRYEEAISYLEKAKQIDPNNPKLDESKKEIGKDQANILCLLGSEAATKGNELFQSFVFADVNAARMNSAPKFIESGSCFLLATKYDVDNLQALKSISALAEGFKWISWTDEFKEKAKIFNAIQEAQKRRLDLLDKLSQFREDLRNAENDLSQTKQKKGFFARMNIKNAEAQVEYLKERISYFENEIQRIDEK